MKSLFKQLRAIAQYLQKPVTAGHTIQKILSSRYSSIPLALNLLIFLPALLTFRPTPVKAVLGTGSFGQRYSADLRGDIVLIGNTLTTCTSVTACNNILNGTNTTGNNQTAGITAARVDVDSNTSTTNSSMAGLRLPAGSTVVRAYLYYQSSQAGTTQPPQDTQVLFGRTSPGVSATSSDYQTVTATAIENFSTSATRGFTAVADVTSIVNSLGSGDYWVGNLDGYTNLGSWSGWSLVVVFSNPTQNIRNLSVNDGSAVVGVLSTISSQDVTISGFKAPNTGIFDVKIGAVAYDGDRGSADNGYQINNINITDSQNTATDAFNSSITDMGAFYPPTWGRNPNHINNLSVDIDLLSAPTPATIANGATTAKFTVASSTETLYLQALTTSIEIAAISGTLYRDNNNNSTFNTGEPTLPAGITVRLLNPTDNSVITTTTTAADGTYTFTRINDGNYKVQVDTTDTDIPADLRLVTPNDLAVLVAGAPVNGQSFGFVPSADLSLTKTVNNASPNVGDNVTFTVTLNNTGPNSATGVNVADLLPTGLTFVSATPSTGTSYNNTTGVWTVGTVASATSTTLQIVATVATAGAKTNTAQVSASAQIDPDSTPNNNVAGEDDQASVTVTPPVADLSLTKIVNNASPNGGDNVTFTVTLSNAGPNSATGVSVADLLPAGLTFVSASPSQGTYDNTTGIWTVGAVASATSTTLQIVATVATVGAKTNTAQVSASAQIDPDSTPNNNVAGEDDQASVTVTPPVADLSLTKIVNNASPNVGDNVTFTVTLNNAGTNSATGVNVADLLPTGLTFVSATPSQGTYSNTTGIWTVGTVASATSTTLQIVATVATAGAKTNTAQVSASAQIDPDSTPNNNVAGEDDQASVTVTPPVADLSLTKIVNNASPNVGDNVTFTVTLNNAGTNSATGVNVADLLPTGLTFVSATPSQGTYSNTTGIWTVGTVASATSTTLQIVATVATAGAKTNTAQVSASAQIDPDSTPNNNVAGEDDQASVTVTPPTADLSIIKTDSPDPVIAGANLTYTIAVTNNGSATATNATMSDPLPSGTTFQSITTPPGWTCTTPTIGSNGTVSCTNPSLAIGSANFTLVVRVAPNTANNSSLSNTATISSTTSDPNTSNNSSSQTTTVQQSADLRLSKIATPAVGGTFDYTITVTNDGPSTATNVQVTDQLPPTTQVAVTSVGITTTQGTTIYNATTPNVVWNVGTLAPNASATLTIPATKLTSGNTLNTAEVTLSDQSDPDSTPGNGQVGEDDRDSVTVPNQSVDLAVVKTVNNPTPNIGSNVTFTITVTNPTASTTAATNVGLSDILPSGLTYQSNTVSTGTYNSGSGVWSIASLSPGTTATLAITATVTTSGAKTNTAQLSALDQTDPNLNNNSSSATVTPASIPPHLLLVKRITAINGVDVTGFQDGVNTPGDPNNVGTKAAEDNDSRWPVPNTTSLRGAIHSSMIAPTISLKPGDEVEYTIYFLNNGASQADNVSVCDFVPANQTYIGTGYTNLATADVGGLTGSNYGIAILSANGGTPVKATNANDGDRGQFYKSSFPSSCTGTSNGNGAVVVNMGSIPNATGSGTPANSYGFIRFKAKIN